MDFQCLFLAAKLMRRPCFVLRTAAASALGALYACVALFLHTSGVFAFLADCGVCLLMCFIAFWGAGVGVRRLLISFSIYFGVSCAVGGVMSGMASLLTRAELPLGTRGDISSAAFFLLAVLGGALTFLWGRFCQRRAKGKRVELTLSLEGRRVSVCCLVDTANLLRDPVSGRPVALLDVRLARQLLPDALTELVESGDPANLTALPSELARRVRLIPARTATGQGLLPALAPDLALLNAGRGALAVELLVAPTRLAVDMDDYQALLPATLIVD